MKCISLWQPWATLWVSGAKIHETRHWGTNVRGTIAVHAALKRDAEARELCLSDPYRAALVALGCPTLNDLPFGAIVGTVDLIDCLRTEAVYDADADLEDYPDDYWFGWFEPGRFAWKAENPVRFAEPIPWKGSQGFFEVELGLILRERRLLRG